MPVILPGKVATLLECFPLTWGTVGKRTSNIFFLRGGCSWGGGRDRVPDADEVPLSLTEAVPVPSCRHNLWVSAA